MATLVIDPLVEEQIRKERAAHGADRYDEVWEGTYMMAPMPNMEHQGLAARLTSVLDFVIRQSNLGEVFAGANVSDREEDWLHNYRGPDVVVVLNGSRAKNCGTHLCGGPDFLIEIVSPGDASRDKFAFYGGIGVRELMIVDRDPWRLELYQLQGDQMSLAGQSRLEEPTLLASNVVPLTFRLLAGDVHPQIEMTHRDGVHRWIV
jgi:Uma2 family endonuclease